MAAPTRAALLALIAAGNSVSYPKVTGVILLKVAADVPADDATILSDYNAFQVYKAGVEGSVDLSAITDRLDDVEADLSGATAVATGSMLVRRTAQGDANFRNTSLQAVDAVSVLVSGLFKVPYLAGDPAVEDSVNGQFFKSSIDGSMRHFDNGSWHGLVSV